jgi:hypothetical protein
MTRSIGGRLNLAALAALAGADRHRPQTLEEMRAAVHELHQRGMSDHTIAQATGLAVEQVRRLLGEPAGASPA